jgi:hypothetical protein
VQTWSGICPDALVGCMYIGEKHFKYVQHLKLCHPNFKNVECNFPKICKRRFDGIEDLIEHLKVSHSARGKSVPIPPVTVINVPCQCNRLTCRGRAFDNVNELMGHWNTFHSNEERDCIFLGCSTTFGVSSVSRNHFRLKHKYTGQMTLKPRHLTGREFQEVSSPPEDISTTEAFEEEAFEEVNEVYDEDAFNEIANADFNEESENYYLSYYADWLNRLVNMKYIPVSTVQQIAEEYLSNTQKSLERREKVLRKSLGNIPGIN